MQGSTDRAEIENILCRERVVRDMEQWDDLAACYNADSIVDISWFNGTGAEFARASAGMTDRLFSFHEIGATVTDICGNRALTDTGVAIHLIAEVHGIEVDCVGYIRSRARLERKTDKWLMSGLRAVYIHDLMIPLNPSCVPQLDTERLATFRRSYRYLAYMLVARGLPARDDLPGVDQPETVKALIDAEEKWLQG